MKRCRECGTEKPTSEYYKNSETADGLLGHCKACHKEIVAANKLKRPDHYRAYARERSQLPAKRAQTLRWMRDNPEKTKPKRAVYLALRKGTLVKPTNCEAQLKRCLPGGRIEAHHEDYSRPLDVIWVCRPCGAQLNMERHSEVAA